MRYILLRILTIFFCVWVCSGTVYATGDWGPYSALLSPNMTEKQVINAIGAQPNKVELQTCGGHSQSGAWQCKIYTFGDFYSNLSVMFYEDKPNRWRVNSWSVYP